jgi:peptidoglycan/LPS O-acetylase OafA/YrhL
MVRQRGDTRRPHKTLANTWSSVNGMGALRLLMAVAVIFSHAPGLASGGDYPGIHFSRGQTSLGPMAVCGFFVLSGLLITRSARRLSLGRFMWHRVLRIMPAFWFCLLVTAFVVAPILAHHEHMSMSTLFSHPLGPVNYLLSNWGLGIQQWGIADLLSKNVHPFAMNGSLWSLGLEMLCYLTVAALAAVGILKRARWFVLVLMLAAYVHLVVLALDYPQLQAPFYAPVGKVWTLPLIGWISADQLIPLMFIFGLGATAELYRERVPINTPLAIVALVTVVATARYGAFVIIGVPAFAYLVLWCAMRAPGPITRIGSRADLSYGIYIYGYIAQQCLTAFGWNRWGLTAYNTITVVLTVVASAFSWYVVEKPALKLKNLGYDDLHRLRLRLSRPRSRPAAVPAATVQPPQQTTDAPTGVGSRT